MFYVLHWCVVCTGLVCCMYWAGAYDWYGTIPVQYTSPASTYIIPVQFNTPVQCTIHCMYCVVCRAAVGRLGVWPEAGRPASPAWQAKLVDIIVYKCQSLMLCYVIALSINEACLSVSTIPIPSAQRLKPVSNPDLWEYNPEDLVRFAPLRKFSSTVVV